MKINEFLAEINMLPEAVHLLNKLQESGRIGEEEYQENKLLYEKDRALFYEKILLEKDYRLVFLYYLCRMGAETYDAYEKRGISREIFRLLSVLPPEFGNDLPHSSCTVTGANRHRLPISVPTETSPVLLRGYLLPHCPKTYTDRFLSVRTSGGILLLFSAFLVFFRKH